MLGEGQVKECVNRERKRDEKKQMENKTTSHPAVPKTQHPFAPSPPVSTLLPCLPFSDFPLQTQIPRRGRNENFQSDERMGKKWAQTNRKDRRDKKKLTQDVERMPNSNREQQRPGLPFTRPRYARPSCTAEDNQPSSTRPISPLRCCWRPWRWETTV